MRATHLRNIAAALLIGLTATPALAQQGPPLTLTVIETTPDIQDIPFLATVKMAPEYGMKIETVVFNGGGEAGEVFVGGRGDLLLAGGDKAVGMNRVTPGQMKIVAGLLNSGGWSLAVLKDPPIKTVQDLKGKNISITGPNSSTEMFVRYGLNAVGLNPDRDASLIQMGAPPNLQAALENKKVDASALAGGYLMFPLQAGTIRLLADYESLPYLGDDFIARSKDINGDRAPALKRYFQLYKLALAKVHSDPAFAMSVARERFPKGYTDQQLTDLIKHHVDVLWKPMDGVVTKAIYDNSAGVWVGSGRYKAADVPAYELIVSNLIPG